LAAACKRVRIDHVGYLEDEVRMADFGVFIGYGTPVRGRERQAIKLFDETVEYYTRLQQQGEIESFEPVMLQPHGGDLNGFILLRGERDKLVASILASDEFTRLSTRADLLLERFGVVGALLGERIGTVNQVYNEQVEELT
jgi:hypothetical protein